MTGKSRPKPSSLAVIVPVVTHILCILLYALPITRTNQLVTNPESTLDEIHITGAENHDVRGTSTIADVFRNDYWGRPMTSPSSHKSWRPLTVLTFRFLHGGNFIPKLLCHRMVNIIIHAAAAELISIASTQIFPWLPENQTILMRALTKLLFALHPTHVEAVANAANRPHILAVLSSVTMVDPSVNMVLMMIMCAFGLLCSETTIFQMPAVLLTMLVIQYNRSTTEEDEEENDDENEKKEKTQWSTLGHAIVKVLPRYFIIAVFSASYLFGRHYYDTLSIPDGLIRPAENPYYTFVGMRRFLNYAYILSVHVCKSFFLDPIGFSHEYGFDCVEEMTGPSDARLLLPQMLAIVTLITVVWCLKLGLRPTLVLLMGLSWFATLFPVSGIVKVGTFIADRIVIASTFTVSIFGGRMLSEWIIGGSHTESVNKPTSVNVRRLFQTSKMAIVMVALAFLWLKVDRRSTQWMDSFSLLKSSLESCPRSAKSNLEMGKIYSGTISRFSHMMDLPKAMHYLEKAEKIDPDYCDVNKEMATVLYQQNNVFEFEDRLTKAVLCPFSMSGAADLWRRYWQAITTDPNHGPMAQERYRKHQKVINDAIEREKVKEEQAGREKNQGKTDEL